jgi:hypothetical protein
MRADPLPIVTPLLSRRPTLQGVRVINGVVIENLKAGDKIFLKSPFLGTGKIEVSDIELERIGFLFSGLSSNVTVYGIGGNPLTKVGKIRLEQLPEGAAQALLKPKSLSLVPKGRGSELQLFLDYACPSHSRFGTVCNLGLAGDNGFKVDSSEVIAKENKNHAEVVLNLTI